MTNSKATCIAHVPIDDRDPATVRCVILARLSDEGGKDSPIESQIAACREFIARKGWKLVAEPFSEKKSGFRNVRRVALAEVETLIAARAIDAVVVNDFERLARTEERRYAALYHARRFGCEYRFASLGTDGKLDETPMAKAYGAMLQAFGEIERDKIFARTMRGRMHRATHGVPSSGRGGPAYGYQFVGEKPYQTWARRDDEANLLLWIARTLVSDERATARSIAPIALPEGTIPAIVTADVWDLAQATLKRNRTEKSGNLTNPALRSLLLRGGYVFCGHCGRPMYGASSNRGYTRYLCASRFGTNRAACPGGIPQVPAPTLDAWVWERVLVALNTDVVANALLERSGAGVGGDEALRQPACPERRL